MQKRTEKVVVQLIPGYDFNRDLSSLTVLLGTKTLYDHVKV